MIIVTWLSQAYLTKNKSPSRGCFTKLQQQQWPLGKQTMEANHTCGRSSRYCQLKLQMLQCPDFEVHEANFGLKVRPLELALAAGNGWTFIG